MFDVNILGKKKWNNSPYSVQLMLCTANSFVTIDLALQHMN